jgi:8-oxo-dGTP pyrophosphatase MutT (NUDIX family)
VTAADPDPVPGAGERDLVRAAGCVVWRRGPSGQREVLLVHRPRYDDWSLPKGKLDPGESDLECARREVLEETGLTGTIGPELRSTRYQDRKGRPKLVRYWAMQPTGGRFEPNDEVDEVRWLGPDEAGSLMSYDHDRDVLASFLERVPEGQGG